MSNKEKVHKSRHKKRLACFSPCFSSSVIEEFDGSESTSNSREKASPFCWPSLSFKKKRKTIPIEIDAPAKSTLAFHQNKEKLHEAKRNKERCKNQQTTSLPKISFKYQSRSQQSSSQNSITSTVRIATRTDLPGSIGPNRSLVPSEALNCRPLKLDPLIALSILGVTVALVVVFGRVHAIVCLCFCFYLLPPRKTTTRGQDEKSRVKTVKLDLESESHKKQVVLQGLLERKGRQN